MLWVLIRITSKKTNNRCCGYSLESARQGDSKEYPQHMFLWTTGENYPLIITKYPPYLVYCESAPSGTVWSGSTLFSGNFSQTYLPEKLRIMKVLTFVDPFLLLFSSSPTNLHKTCTGPSSGPAIECFFVLRPVKIIWLILSRVNR